MKFLMQRVVVVVAVVSVVIACCGIAQAKPGFGENCSGCHAQSGGALDVLPSSLVEIKAGETGQITFDVTDVPAPDAAIALTGLDDANLMATVGAGWAAVPAFSQWATEPFFDSAGPQVLDLAVDASAVAGDYPVGIQLAGGPGFGGWSSAYDFTLRISNVPEPATLALLLTGFGAIGLVTLRRRR